MFLIWISADYCLHFSPTSGIIDCFLPLCSNLLHFWAITEALLSCLFLWPASPVVFPGMNLCAWLQICLISLLQTLSNWFSPCLSPRISIAWGFWGIASSTLETVFLLVCPRWYLSFFATTMLDWFRFSLESSLKHISLQNYSLISCPLPTFLWLITASLYSVSCSCSCFVGQPYTVLMLSSSGNLLNYQDCLNSRWMYIQFHPGRYH